MELKIDHDTFLVFLRQHPAMPSEFESTDELDGQYEALFGFLEKYPDEQCSRLLILSITPLARPSLCQRISDVLHAHHQKVRESLITEAIQSGIPCIQEWAVLFAGEFPSLQYLPLLRSLLQTAETSEETVINIVEALEAIRDSLCSVEADEILQSDFKNNVRWKALQSQMSCVARAERVIAFERDRLQAEHAFQQKNYAKVVRLLEPHKELLTPVLSTKLTYAKRNTFP
jgi:hypothetical protein